MAQETVRKDLEKVLEAVGDVPVISRFADGDRVLWLYLNPVYLTGVRWLTAVASKVLDIAWRERVDEAGVRGWVPDVNLYNYDRASKATDVDGVPDPCLRRWREIRDKLVAEATAVLGRILHERGLE